MLHTVVPQTSDPMWLGVSTAAPLGHTVHHPKLKFNAQLTSVTKTLLVSTWPLMTVCLLTRLGQYFNVTAKADKLFSMITICVLYIFKRIINWLHLQYRALFSVLNMKEPIYPPSCTSVYTNTIHPWDLKRRSPVTRQPAVLSVPLSQHVPRRAPCTGCKQTVPVCCLPEDEFKRFSHKHALSK